MRTLFLPLLLLSFTLSAQRPPRTFHTSNGTVVLHYFADGRVSTKESMDADGRWGHSWAYDRSGETIVDRATRTVAGHARVHFEYHPDGGVSKAEFSDAPDGGIQWYRSITTFDPEGRRTGFIEQGHDDDGPVLRPELIGQP